MPIYWHPRCPACQRESLGFRRLGVCNGHPVGRKGMPGSIGEVLCPDCGWRQRGPIGGQAFLIPHEIGTFYGLTPSSSIVLDAVEMQTAVPYDGDVSVGEPSREELEVHCLHLKVLPVHPAATTRDQALEMAELADLAQRVPGASTTAAFGILTHDQWYQELSGGDRIEFVQDRPVWMLAASWPLRRPVPGTTLPPSPRERLVRFLDAASGRKLLEYTQYPVSGRPD